MSFELSAEQERARAAILSWYRSPHRKPWFYLNGPAGSGKSSVITATTSCIPGNIIYAAPTGRAALVMRKKGCIGARTVHSVLFTPKGLSGNRKQIETLRSLLDLSSDDPKSHAIKQSLLPSLADDLKRLESRYANEKTKDNDAPEPKRIKALKIALATNISNAKDLISSSPLFEINPDSELKDADLLVIDEISMCGKDLIDAALSFRVPMLVQGDSAQLPPVMSVSPFLKEKPDFSLTKVHRQAADSPIIFLATLAREGKPLPLGRHGDCLVTRD